MTEPADSSRIDGMTSVRLLCRWLRSPSDAAANVAFRAYYEYHFPLLNRMLEMRLRVRGAESAKDQAGFGYQELMTDTCNRLKPRHERLLRTHLLLAKITLPTSNDLWRRAFEVWCKEAQSVVGQARWVIHLYDDPDLLPRVEGLNTRLKDLRGRGMRLLVQRLNEANVALADSKGKQIAPAGQIEVDELVRLFVAVLDQPFETRLEYLNRRFPGLARPQHDGIRQSLCDFGEILVRLGQCRLRTAGYLIASLDNVARDQLRQQLERTLSPDAQVETDSGKPPSAGPVWARIVSIDDGDRIVVGEVPWWRDVDAAQDPSIDDLASARAAAAFVPRSVLWLTLDKLLRREQIEGEAELAAIAEQSKLAATADGPGNARGKALDVKREALEAKLAQRQRSNDVLILKAFGYGQEEMAALLGLSRDQVRQGLKHAGLKSVEMLRYWLHTFGDHRAVRTRILQWGADSEKVMAVLDGMFEGLTDPQIAANLSLTTRQVAVQRDRLAEVAADIVAEWIERALADRARTESALRELNSDIQLMKLRALKQATKVMKKSEVMRK